MVESQRLLGFLAELDKLLLRGCEVEKVGSVGVVVGSSNGNILSSDGKELCRIELDGPSALLGVLVRHGDLVLGVERTLFEFCFPLGEPVHALSDCSVEAPLVQRHVHVEADGRPDLALFPEVVVAADDHIRAVGSRAAPGKLAPLDAACGLELSVVNPGQTLSSLPSRVEWRWVTEQENNTQRRDASVTLIATHGTAASRVTFKVLAR